MGCAHTHTQWRIKCFMFGQVLVGKGECFLSSLISPFFFFFFAPFSSFCPSLKLSQGLEGLNGMLRRRSLMANNHRLEQWWPTTVLGPYSAPGSKGHEAIEDRHFWLRNLDNIYSHNLKFIFHHCLLPCLRVSLLATSHTADTIHNMYHDVVFKPR